MTNENDLYAILEVTISPDPNYDRNIWSLHGKWNNDTDNDINFIPLVIIDGTSYNYFGTTAVKAHQSFEFWGGGGYDSGANTHTVCLTPSSNSPCLTFNTPSKKLTQSLPTLSTEPCKPAKTDFGIAPFGTSFTGTKEFNSVFIAKAGKPIQFIAVDGHATDRTWKVEGTIQSEKSNIMTTTFDKPGIYHVSLIAVTECGGEPETTKPVCVFPSDYSQNLQPILPNGTRRQSSCLSSVEITVKDKYLGLLIDNANVSVYGIEQKSGKTDSNGTIIFDEICCEDKILIKAKWECKGGNCLLSGKKTETINPGKNEIEVLVEPTLLTIIPLPPKQAPKDYYLKLASEKLMKNPLTLPIGIALNISNKDTNQTESRYYDLLKKAGII